MKPRRRDRTQRSRIRAAAVMVLRHRISRRALAAMWFAAFVGIALAVPYLSQAAAIGLTVGTFVALNLLSITRCGDRDACERPPTSEVQHDPAAAIPPTAPKQ